MIRPSSLTIVLPSALGFSPHLPESVCGTDTIRIPRGFSWQRGVEDFVPLSEIVLASRGIRARGFACGPPLPASTATTDLRLLYPSASPLVQLLMAVGEYQRLVHRLRFSASA